MLHPKRIYWLKWWIVCWGSLLRLLLSRAIWESLQKKWKLRKNLNSRTKLKQNLELALVIEIESSDNDSCKKDTKDYELLQGMMEEMKLKFKESNSYAKRVQILTLSSYIIERTVSKFGATNYLVKKSRSIKKELGILGECAKSKGKAISQILQNMIVCVWERKRK